MSERVWLNHPATGGYFHCPTEAAEHFKKLGWTEATEPPAEPNPVVAEHIEWERQQAAADRKPSKTKSPSTSETTGDSNG